MAGGKLLRRAAMVVAGTLLLALLWRYVFFLTGILGTRPPAEAQRYPRPRPVPIWIPGVERPPQSVMRELSRRPPAAKQRSKARQ